MLDPRIVLFIYFFRNLHTVFLFGYTSLHSHQTMYKLSLLSTSLTTFVTCCLFNDSVLTAHCGFDLPFPDNS